MIVVSTKETKEPSGLSQLLLGKDSADENKFSKFLESFELIGLADNEDKEIVVKNSLKSFSEDIQVKTDDTKVIIVDVKSDKKVIDKSENVKSLLKETNLSVLLQGEEIETEEFLDNQIKNLQETESDFLHPKMINTLSEEDIKTVVKSAKVYLKEQIETIAKEQNIDLKNTPQTLKGLSELAKKLGVNLQKITLEDVATPKLKEKTVHIKESIPVLDMKKQEPQIQVSTLRATFVPNKEQTNKIKKEEPLQKALHVKLNDNNNIKESTNIVDGDVVELFKTESKKVETLTQLLQGNIENEETASKQVSLEPKELKVSQSTFVDIAPKDSLEVKAKEAQQMLRHFATDLKDAVENYKPPFTRVKMTLNPAKLGEVDVTLIQRGNNVHINVNSNNTALTLLAQNVNELKTQLANNGVINTSMQFSTSHGEHQHQEGRHQQFQNYKEFEQMSEEEVEMITSMEIILPKYV